MDPMHRRLAEIGLRVAARHGFALAGGYAVAAHGLVHRPSEDVDLFTAWDCRDEFDAAAEAVVAAYRQAGYAVDVAQRFETFARLMVTVPDSGQRPYKVELASNWRAQAPIMMEIGPVLHVDDVVAGKMSALYTRAEPRDFIDVDAAVTSGRYTYEELCQLAEQSDAGFDRQIMAELLGVLPRYPDRRFAAYGLEAEQIAGMRQRFAAWRTQLLGGEADTN
jgi:hypothetical protein